MDPDDDAPLIGPGLGSPGTTTDFPVADNEQLIFPTGLDVPDASGIDWDAALANLRTGPGYRIGLVGGRRSGKTYLFQSLVYRASGGAQAGALAPFMDGTTVEVFESADVATEGNAVELRSFLRRYRDWQELGTTRKEVMAWYRLRLGFPSGWVGGRREHLDVQFLDAPGEELARKPVDARGRYLWRRAYVGASLMVFCLPLWVIFPGALDPRHVEWRGQILNDWSRILENLKLSYKEAGVRPRYRSVLALTMADDPQGGLEVIRERWVDQFLDHYGRNMRLLSRGAGVVRYLESARLLSDNLLRELGFVGDPELARIVGLLEEGGGGRPWVVPMSAIEGDALVKDTPAATPPRPVHVEIPLLVALCDRYNLLM